MIIRGFCFAIVITHNGGDETAIAAVETRNVAVEREVFAVLVVTLVAHGMADVVKQGCGFQKHARFRWKMMNWLQLVEELEAEFANVFGVAAVAVEAAGKNASAAEEFARVAVIPMRFLAREHFARYFAEQAFTNSDAGYRKRVEGQVAAEREKNDAGDADDICAEAADAIDFHARFDVATQQIGKTFTEKGEFQRGKPVFARAGSQIGKRFGVATKCDRKLPSEIWPR